MLHQVITMDVHSQSLAEEMFKVEDEYSMKNKRGICALVVEFFLTWK